MDDTGLRALIDDVRAGRLARRDVLAHLLALGVPLGTASALLPGTSHAQQAPSTYPPKRGGGALRLVFWQAATQLNPHFASGTKDAESARPFLEPLAWCDIDGRYQPVLAAEIPTRVNGGVAADGRSVTWKLRRNVTWHDGVPFTADDVIFNWKYATDPATATFTGGAYANIKAMDKLDAHTVRFVFEKPSPIWERSCLLQLLPKHHFEKYLGAKAREAPANLKPVGTGPYRFLEFRPGDLVRGERNPSYYLPERPFFDTIEIKGGGDSTSAARAVLQAGEADFGNNIQVEDDVLRHMEASGRGRVQICPTGSTEVILVNPTDPWTEVDGERSSTKSRHPTLSDPAVRQAFRLLVDRQAIEQHVYGRAATATPNWLNHPAAFDSHGVPMTFSVEQANAVLEAAGWKRGADGVREKGGRKLSFVFQTSTNSVRQKVQQIIKQACAKAGIALELKAIASAVFFSSDPGNPDTLGRFQADLEMYALTRAGPDPERFMQSFASWEICRKANGWQTFNPSRWSDPEYDALLRGAGGELDPVKRAGMFIRMNDILCTAGHAVPVVVRLDVAVVGKGIVAPTTGWDIPTSAIHEWYRV